MLFNWIIVLTAYTVYICHVFFFPALGLFSYCIFPSYIFYLSHCCYSICHHAGFGDSSEGVRLHAAASSLVASICFIVVLSACCLWRDVLRRPLGFLSPTHLLLITSLPSMAFTIVISHRFYAPAIPHCANTPGCIILEDVFSLTKWMLETINLQFDTYLKSIGGWF